MGDTMTDSMVYTLGLIICLIGLIELVLEREVKFILAILGIAGAIFIGMFIKNHNWYELKISFTLVIACWFYWKAFYHQQT